MFKKASDVKALQRLSGADRKKLKRNVRERFTLASDADIDVILPPKATICALFLPSTSLQVVLGWSSLLAIVASRLLKCFLSTRKGALWLTIGVIMTTFVMHVFIRFTQSEHSTPAKVAPAKASNGSLSPVVKNEKDN